MPATRPQSSSTPPRPRDGAAPWTFLTNHAHVLLCLASDPELRLRDVAARVGITERAVQHIVADLEAAGMLTRTREGRRNRYALHAERPLRHPVEAHRTVADLVNLVLPLPAPPFVPGGATPATRAAVAPPPLAGVQRRLASTLPV
jgi:DNA-binding transcriptional ArsR family regulator